MKPFEYYMEQEMNARHKAEEAKKKRILERHRKCFNYEKFGLIVASCVIVFSIFLFGLSIGILILTPYIQPNTTHIVFIAEEEVEEDFENEKIAEALFNDATKIPNCKITFYCTEKYPHICNAGEPYKAANGEAPVPYITCAVPSEIPLGATVMVDWGDGVIDYYIATDRGGDINGNHIDLCVTTHQEALNNGIKYADVYWVVG